MEDIKFTQDQAEAVLKEVTAKLIKMVDTLNTQVIQIQSDATDQGYKDASKDQVIFAVYNLAKESLKPALDMSLFLHPESKDFIAALIKQRDEMAQAESSKIEQVEAAQAEA